MEMYLGDRVRFEFSGDWIRGEIVDITIAPEYAEGPTVVFVTVEQLTGARWSFRANDADLARMQFRVTFRDAYVAEAA